MSQHVLILGGSGRFGRHATQAFQAAGWHVSQFDRRRDDLIQVAKGKDVIVNALNPPYEKWQAEVPRLTANVIGAAKASGATVIIPGNVYVYGKDAPARLTPEVSHSATNPLGRVRINMEAAYRASDVQTIILRAGDFIDTEASGNWFDRYLIGKLAKGAFVYPGRMDAAHTWAWLPDLARAAVALAQMRHDLVQFEDVAFPGYALSGEEIAQALEVASGQKLARKPMSWLPLRLMAPFWKRMRHLIEMRYLWNKPHFLDGARFATLLPDFKPTPLVEALQFEMIFCHKGSKDEPDHRQGNDQ